MPLIKEINCKIRDEYGQLFPVAKVFITKIRYNIEGEMVGEEIGDTYSDSNENFLAYEAMYWYSEDTRSKGFKARPLAVDNGEGGFTQAVAVDATHAEYVSIMNSGLSDDDKRSRAVEADIARKFL